MSRAGRVFRKSLDVAAHFALATMNPWRENAQAIKKLNEATGLQWHVSIRRPCAMENPRIALVLSFNERVNPTPYVVQWALENCFGDKGRFYPGRPPRNEVYIYKGDYRKLADVQPEPDTKNILAGAIRAIETAAPKAAPA